MLNEMSKESLYEYSRKIAPCVAFNTRRAARLFTQYYDHALVPSGLRSTQYSLLNALALLGEMPMQDLANMLGMDRTTLTRNLTPLQKKGLVEVLVKSDRRFHPLALTKTGRLELEKAQPYWEKAQSNIVNKIGLENWEQIMIGLHKISMIIDDDETMLDEENNDEL